MSSMVKHTENRRTFYLFPLPETPRDSFNGRTAYLDASDLMKEANRRDKTLGYDREQGPNFGIEHQRAIEYAEYVSQHATAENLFKFNTSKYVFFVNTQESGVSVNRTGKSKPVPAETVCSA